MNSYDDAGLALYLAENPVKELSLNGEHLTVACVDAIVGLKSLESLTLSIPILSPTAVKSLVGKGLKKLILPDYGLGIDMEFIPKWSQVLADIDSCLVNGKSPAHLLSIFPVTKVGLIVNGAVKVTYDAGLPFKNRNHLCTLAILIASQNLDILAKVVRFVTQETLQFAFAQVIDTLGLESFLSKSWSGLLEILASGGLDLNFEVSLPVKSLVSCLILPILFLSEDRVSLRLVHLFAKNVDIIKRAHTLGLDLTSTMTVNNASLSPFSLVSYSGGLAEARVLLESGVKFTGADVAIWLSSGNWIVDKTAFLLTIWSKTQLDTSIWKYLDSNGNSLLHILCQSETDFMKIPEGLPVIQSLLNLMVAISLNGFLARKNHQGYIPLACALMSCSRGMLKFFSERNDFKKLEFDGNICKAVLERKDDELFKWMFKVMDCDVEMTGKQLGGLAPCPAIKTCRLAHALIFYPEALEQTLSTGLVKMDSLMTFTDGKRLGLTVLDCALYSNAPIKTIAFLLRSRAPYLMTWFSKWIESQVASSSPFVENVRKVVALLSPEMIKKVVRNLTLLHVLVKKCVQNSKLFHFLLPFADLSVVDENQDTLLHLFARGRHWDLLINTLRTLKSKDIINLANSGNENFMHVVVHCIQREGVDWAFYKSLMSELYRLKGFSLFTKLDSFEIDPITASIGRDVLTSVDEKWTLSPYTLEMIEPLSKANPPTRSGKKGRTAAHRLCLSFPDILVKNGSTNRRLLRLAPETWVRLFENLKPVWYLDLKQLDDFKCTAFDYLSKAVSVSDQVDRHLYNKMLGLFTMPGAKLVGQTIVLDDLLKLMENGHFSDDLLTKVVHVAFERDQRGRTPAHYFVIYSKGNVRHNSIHINKWLDGLGYSQSMTCEPIDKFAMTPLTISIIMDAIAGSESPTPLTRELLKRVSNLTHVKSLGLAQSPLYPILESVEIATADRDINWKAMVTTFTMSTLVRIVTGLVEIGKVNVNSIDQGGRTILDHLERVKQLAGPHRATLVETLRRLGGLKVKQLLAEKPLLIDVEVREPESSNKRSSETLEDSKAKVRKVEPTLDLRSRLSRENKATSPHSEVPNQPSQTMISPNPSVIPQEMYPLIPPTMVPFLGGFGMQRNLELQAFQQQQYGEMLQLLFDQCAKGDETEIMALVRAGADVRVQNDKEQTPLHVWLISNAHQPRLSKRIALFLFDEKAPLQVLNHFDCHLNTPLSISIVNDVYFWFKDLFPSWRSPTLVKAKVNTSIVTATLLEHGAGLGHQALDGGTVWHGFAHTVFSPIPIPGFPDPNFQASFVYLVVRQFIQKGRLDFNAKDASGQTGLDVLVARRSNGTLQMTETEYTRVMSDLAEFQ